MGLKSFMQTMSLVFFWVILFLSSPLISKATIITQNYNIKGQITGVSSYPNFMNPPDIHVGDPFSGTFVYSYDSNIVPDPDNGYWFFTNSRYELLLNNLEVHSNEGYGLWANGVTASSLYGLSFYDEAPIIRYDDPTVWSDSINIGFYENSGWFGFTLARGGIEEEMGIGGVIDSVTPAPVPEPMSIVLLLTGLAGIAGFKRKNY